jgi:mRNA-degrading endonuclease RelE of RelBE toxin-antitoxin system
LLKVIPNPWLSKKGKLHPKLSSNCWMSFKVIPTPQFEKEVKKLSKKYPSAKEDIGNLVKELKENPTMGVPLANNCFKIRLAIKSKGKGKSGGSRVITHVRVVKEAVHLLTIYDKSDQSAISDTKINRLLEKVVTT